MKEKKIYVLQVVTYMERGGLEMMLMNYYKHINKDIFQFDFLVHRIQKAEFDDEIMHMGGRIFRLPRLNPFSPSYRACLDRFFKEHKEYQIVHVHLDCMSSLVLKYAKKNGVPVRIAHSHNTNQNYDFKYPIKMFYRQFIGKYATELMACGVEAGKWMFNGMPFEVLNNAISAEAFRFQQEQRDSIRKQYKLQEKYIIGHVGSFKNAKNHDFIIEIFAEIKKKQTNAVLVLIGDGINKNKMIHKVREFGLEKDVLFLGIQKNISGFLSAFDRFLFPSLYEGLPVTLIEAQTSGLKCIISDKITGECIFSDSVVKLSLSSSTVYWSEAVLNPVKTDRRSYYLNAVKAGYDIETNVRILEKKYKELIAAK